jgi:hypothetical protein
VNKKKIDKVGVKFEGLAENLRKKENEKEKNYHQRQIKNDYDTCNMSWSKEHRDLTNTTLEGNV